MPRARRIPIQKKDHLRHCHGFGLLKGKSQVAGPALWMQGVGEGQDGLRDDPFLLLWHKQLHVPSSAQEQCTTKRLKTCFSSAHWHEVHLVSRLCWLLKKNCPCVFTFTTFTETRSVYVFTSSFSTPARTSRRSSPTIRVLPGIDPCLIWSRWWASHSPSWKYNNAQQKSHQRNSLMSLPISHILLVLRNIQTCSRKIPQLQDEKGCQTSFSFPSHCTAFGMFSCRCSWKTLGHVSLNPPKSHMPLRTFTMTEVESSIILLSGSRKHLHTKSCSEAAWAKRSARSSNLIATF